MRHRIKLTALLFLLTLAAHGQRLVVDKPTVNCGKTSYQMPVTATFELQNKGPKPLFIEDVHPDCGCMKASLSKTRLKAGEKCTVQLQYDARMLGHFEKSAIVTYTAQEGGGMSFEPVLLKMKGVVLTEVKDFTGSYPYSMGDLLLDKEEVEFDDVNKGDKPQQVIHIVNNSDKTMTPNVQHLPSYLTATVTPVQLLPERTGKVVLTLNSEAIHDFGLTQTSVHLASQLGEKVTQDTEIPISVVLLPDLKDFDGNNRQYAPKMTFSATSLELGNIKGKKQKKAEVIITNTGRLPLEISSIQMFTSGLTLTVDKKVLQAGEHTKLKVVGDLAKLKNLRTKPRVLMITNDPEHSKVVIPIHVR